MEINAVRQGVSIRQYPSQALASPALAVFACLLPALCGACSWVQALQDNLRMSSDNAPAQPLALPITEVQVRMVYPDGTTTVDGAVSYMLEPHAYRPSYRNGHGERIAQRGFMGNFGSEPVALSVALERLVGRDGQVVLDRGRKLYAFRPRHPGEPGVAFADLGIETTAAAATPPGSWERLDHPIPAAAENIGSGNIAAGDIAAENIAPDNIAAENIAPGNIAAPNIAPRTIASSNRASGNIASRNAMALTAADSPPPETEDETHAVADRGSCHSIRFRNRSMLSTIVRNYFLECGFDEVFWKLGEPGRYADYRLSQDIDVPLPERHLDLIDLLQARFGIMTLINEDNSVEFHDQNSVY